MNKIRLDQRFEPTEKLILWGIRDKYNKSPRSWMGNYVWANAYDAAEIIDRYKNIEENKYDANLEVYIVAEYKRTYYNPGGLDEN